MAAAAAATVTRLAARASAAGRLYKVSQGGSVEVYPSVTSVLSILDKAALVPWAVRTSLDVVRRELTAQVAAGCPNLAPPPPPPPQPAGAPEAAPSPPPPPPAPPAAWVESVLARAAAAPDDAKSAAASFGTRAHAAIDAIIRGEPAPAPVEPDVARVVDGFRRWYARSGIVLCPAGDTPVYSRTYRYAGAADCLGYRPATGALVVLDFKTSNSIHATYALQLAAYAHAVREMWASGELDVEGLVMRSGATAAAAAAAAAAAELPVVDGGDSAPSDTHPPQPQPQPRARRRQAYTSAAASQAHHEAHAADGEPGVTRTHGAPATAATGVDGGGLGGGSADFGAGGLGSLGGVGDLGGMGGAFAQFDGAPTPPRAPTRTSSRRGGTSAASSARSGTAAAAGDAAPVSKPPRKARTATGGSKLAPASPPGGPIVDEATLLLLTGIDVGTHVSAGSGSSGSRTAQTLPTGQQRASFSTLLGSSSSAASAHLCSDGASVLVPRTRSLSSTAGPATTTAGIDTASAPFTGTDSHVSAAASSAPPTAPAAAVSFVPRVGPEGVPVEALVIRLDKATGTAEVKRVGDLAAAFDAFKAALLLWHAVGGGATAAGHGSSGGGSEPLLTHGLAATAAAAAPSPGA